MKTSPLQRVILIVATILLAAPLTTAADDASRLAPLNGYWTDNIWLGV